MALKRKTFILDENLVREAQQLLGTRTETEAVVEALRSVVLEKQVLADMRRVAGRGRGHFDFDLFPDWQ